MSTTIVGEVQFGGRLGDAVECDKCHQVNASQVVTFRFPHRVFEQHLCKTCSDELRNLLNGVNDE